MCLCQCPQSVWCSVVCAPRNWELSPFAQMHQQQAPVAPGQHGTVDPVLRILRKNKTPNDLARPEPNSSASVNRPFARHTNQRKVLYSAYICACLASLNSIASSENDVQTIPARRTNLLWIPLDPKVTLATCHHSSAQQEVMSPQTKRKHILCLPPSHTTLFSMTTPEGILGHTS